jgi:hypothetical protein
MKAICSRSFIGIEWLKVMIETFDNGSRAALSPYLCYVIIYQFLSEMVEQERWPLKDAQGHYDISTKDTFIQRIDLRDTDAFTGLC